LLIIGNRYVCSHETHELLHFPNWSSLQAHLKDQHPPSCHYAECVGRTFGSQRSLKAHLKVHEEREIDLERQGVQSSEIHHTVHPLLSKKERKRKRQAVVAGGKSPKLVRIDDGEEGKAVACDHEGCTKAYKTVRLYQYAKRRNMLSMCISRLRI
jgi:general transcription factor IIIA